MTPQETLVLVRYVRACCPQQHIDEYTPDAWHDLLSDLDLADCRQAVATVARRQPFVAPAEIRAAVRALREERIRLNPPAPPPPELCDDDAAYRRHLRQSIAAAASGSTGPRQIGGPR